MLIAFITIWKTSIGVVPENFDIELTGLCCRVNELIHSFDCAVLLIMTKCCIMLFKLLFQLIWRAPIASHLLLSLLWHKLSEGVILGICGFAFLDLFI